MTPQRARDLPRFAPALAVGAAFVVSRALYWKAGVRFWSDSVYFYSQLLDPRLLSGRLAESLWFLHAQPPLFNLLTGLALKLSPVHFGALLRAAYLFVGLAIVLAMLGTLRRLAVPAWVAVCAAAAFGCMPAFVIYENWYFYPLLELGFVQLTAYALLRSEGRPGRWMGLALALGAGLVCLRSLYHPIVFALFGAGLLALAAPPDRRRLLRQLAVPALVVALLVAKNAAVFGFFGTSSWGGNSLHRVARKNVPPAELARLVDAGALSRVSLDWEFSSGAIYRDHLALGDRDRGVPALDEIEKTPLRAMTRVDPVNYNHWSYLPASKAYLRDALFLIRTHPAAYAAAVASNLRRFTDPVTDDRFVAENRDCVAGLDRLGARIERPLLWLCPVAWIYALVVLARRRAPRGELLLLAFALGTTLWATALGLLVETGENNRFRFHLMGLQWLLFVYALRDLIYWARIGRARGAARAH
jgi:hypothetical protein